MESTIGIQIGNWLLDKSGIPKQVTEIYDDSVTLDGELNHISTVEPIPLTHAILEQNGFVLRSESPYRKEYDLVLPREDGDEDYFCVDIHEKGGYCWVCYNPIDNITHITYIIKDMAVHQLQNAMRMCGIKMEFIV